MTITPDLDTLFHRLAHLTASQSSLLRRIADHGGPVTVADLAGETDLHTSSVREVLDALVSLGLVRSIKMPAQGRGRPAMGYVANTEPRVIPPVSMIRMLTECCFEWLDAAGVDSSQAAEQIGALMATKALALMHVPTHHPPPPGFDLGPHLNKIRMFLTAFGMGAAPHPHLTTALILGACPFDDSQTPSSVALGLRRGFVEGVIDHTSCGTVQVRFEPDAADPRRCTVVLSTDGIVTDEQTMITLKFFGASADAAGCFSEQARPGHQLGQVLDEAVQRHPELEPILPVSTFLVDDRPTLRDQPISPGATVEVLPPFAGG